MRALILLSANNRPSWIRHLFQGPVREARTIKGIESLPRDLKKEDDPQEVEEQM
jgi:hypothetical protein